MIDPDRQFLREGIRLEAAAAWWRLQRWAADRRRRWFARWRQQITNQRKNTMKLPNHPMSRLGRIVASIVAVACLAVVAVGVTTVVDSVSNPAPAAAATWKNWGYVPIFNSGTRCNTTVIRGVPSISIYSHSGCLYKYQHKKITVRVLVQFADTFYGRIYRFAGAWY